MQKDYYIAEFEELVLLAILKLGSGAYGAAIHELLKTRDGELLSAHFTLLYLASKRRA
ncbi:MAG TPA: hypothetical protein VJ749_01380 [Pyrinomonadaceae bacterium]|nr:hypothetical protein [Pyrinomonadaceae bacterium]